MIVRITASGVCHSDLSVINGTLPAGRVVLGHEGAGVIEKVGSDVSGLAVGDRVIGSFIPACGVCWYCLHDQSNLCEHTYNVMFVPRVKRADGEEMVAMTGLGTFAELMTVQQMSVVKVETDLPDEQLALIGCGVTTGVGAALNTAQVEPGSIVAVIGCGGVGQAVIQGARIAGAARIIAIDPVALKRDEALKNGATARRRPDRRRSDRGGEGAQRRPRRRLRVRGDRHCRRPCARRVDGTRPGGTAVMVGVPKLGTDIAIPAMTVLEEKRILGCVYGGASVRRDFPRLISLIEHGKLDVGDMVTKTMHLHEVNDAITAMQNGEVIRSVLVND